MKKISHNLVAAVFLGGCILLASVSAEETPAPILKAATSDDISALQSILKTDPDAWKIKDKSGNQALHLASLNGSVESAKVLLTAGADINAKGFFDWTPLHYAARGAHDEICRLLLEAGANRDLKNGTKQTPLQVADGFLAKEVIANFLVVPPGAEEFIKAARDGKIDEVRRWLDKEPKLIDARNSKGYPAVNSAASENRIEVLKLLIERGADINQHSKEHSTALTEAAGGGHLDAVRLLLKHSAEVNPSRPDGGTVSMPLRAAAFTTQATAAGAYLGDRTWMMKRLTDGSPDTAAIGKIGDDLKSIAPEAFVGSPQEMTARMLKPAPEPLRQAKRAILRLLLEAGADPKKDEKAITAAAMSGETEMVRLLLEHGANPNAEQTGWATTIGGAVNVSAPLSVIQLLLAAGADPLRVANRELFMGRSALSIAVQYKNEEVIAAILAALKPDTLSEEEHYAVLEAVVFSDPASLTKVLAAGFDPNAEKKSKWTLLNRACRGDNAESVRLLLEAGAEVNTKDSEGYTPLHTAAENGRTKNVVLLLKHGADIEAKNTHDFTPLFAASGRGRGNLETARLLLDAGAKIDYRTPDGYGFLHSASDGGKIKIVRICLSKGFKVNARTKDGRTPLHFAAGGGSPELVALLLDSGAQINAVQDKYPSRSTPLTWAVQYGKIDNIKLLLKRGADLHATLYSVGATQLHYAAQNNQVESAKALIEAGIKVDARDDAQQTPLMVAVTSGNPEVVKFLIKEGADVNAKATGGMTALKAAVRAGKTSLILLLKENGAKE